MTDTGTIHAAAFHHLKVAGFKFDDADMVKLFDLSAITVRDGRVIVPPSFIRQARAEKPDWFSDASRMSANELRAAVKKLADDHARQQVQAEQAAFLKSLKRKYGAQ